MFCTECSLKIVEVEQNEYDRRSTLVETVTFEVFAPGLPACIFLASIFLPFSIFDNVIWLWLLIKNEWQSPPSSQQQGQYEKAKFR